MKKAIIGAGGFSSELQAYMSESNIDYGIYVSDEYYRGESNTYKLSELDPMNSSVILAFSDTRAKKQLIQKLPVETNYFTFIHPSAIVYSLENIGAGTVIGPNCVITTNVKIGNHCLINCNITIGHSTIINDYCTLNPGISLSGDCILNEGVFVGSNAAIREKTTIAEWTTIGMGTVVTKNISEPNKTYVGVPARSIE
jgi:sugar O-acyltransferase (sialic acid O-acetyltransferase NeuD family)